MVPFALCTPLSLISVVAGFLNTPTQALQAPVKPVAPVNFSIHTNQAATLSTTLIISEKPIQTAVRDSVQSIRLDSQASAVIPSDAHLMRIKPQFNGGQSTLVPDQDAVAGAEDQLVVLINRERAAEGLGQLTQDPLLASIAKSHSEDMCNRGYFDHLAPAPGPVTPMDRFLAAVSTHPDYAMVGENIYYRSTTDSIADYAPQAHDAFMASPGHRANVLMPEYTRVGVGIYQNPVTGEFWVTEMFLRDTQ